jgi:HAD superfamily hydrolase (TIGR01662 family)
MSNEAVAAVLARAPNVLLDFDGPVCSVFGNLSDRTVADRLKMLLGDGLPPAIEATDDPFKVLHYSDTVDSSTVRAVERQLRQLEVEAVTYAPATPGAAAAMESLVEAGHTLSIVSNNSAEAVDAYLSLHGLRHLVSNISARARSDPGLLKPSPHLLEQAIESLGVKPNQCVMVGDSVSDIEAACRAGTAIVAYANKPGKRERFGLHHPDAIVDHMTGLMPACAAS